MRREYTNYNKIFKKLKFKSFNFLNLVQMLLGCEGRFK